MTSGALGGRVPRPSYAPAPAVPTPPELAFDPAARALADRLRPPVLIALAIGLWAVSLPAIDPRQMNDLGLVSVLPVTYFVALAVLTIGFGIEVTRPELNRRALVGYLITFIVIVYGTTAIVEDAPRFAVTWLHAGFIEYIDRTGTVAPEFEARFNWPGFFILGALLVDLAGLDSALAIAAWAPVFFGLLALPALLMLYRNLDADERLVWTAAWLFFIGNWIAQDYFAPQALNFIFFLVIIAILVEWFRLPGGLPELFAHPRIPTRVGALAAGLLTGPSIPIPSTSARQRAGLLLVIVAIYAASVSSHQLTPFFTLGAAIALVILRHVRLRGLPILMGVLVTAWLSFMTIAFLAGHLVDLLSEIGRFGGTLNENVANRIQGSAEHQFVIFARLAFTLGIWGLAGLGFLRRLRRGSLDLTIAALAVAPFPFLALQAYGGEMLLRAYLFSLPFMALLAASTVQPLPAIPRLAPRYRAAPAIALALVIAAGFLVTRFGNERVDFMTANEHLAMERLYEAAPRGSLLVAASPNLPWKYEHLEWYDYVPVTDEVLVGDSEAILDILRDDKYPRSFLVLTRSQGAYADVFTGLPPGAWDRFVDSVSASPELRLLYRNADARVLELIRDETPAGEPAGIRSSTGQVALPVALPGPTFGPP